MWRSFEYYTLLATPHSFQKQVHCRHSKKSSLRTALQPSHPAASGKNPSTSLHQTLFQDTSFGVTVRQILTAPRSSFATRILAWGDDVSHKICRKQDWLGAARRVLFSLHHNIETPFSRIRIHGLRTFHFYQHHIVESQENTNFLELETHNPDITSEPQNAFLQRFTYVLVSRIQDSQGRLKDSVSIYSVRSDH